MDDRPIGVFDSGLGGLTVLKEIRGLLPGENIIYFGDCGRAPYGIKSPETIVRYTYQNIRFFQDAGVKLLVIACNTSSAYSYDLVAGDLDIPVVEVIRPGSAAASRATRSKKIGVIGTPATVASGIYERVIGGIDPSIEVSAKACPLFVPIAEEGPFWWGHPATRSVAEEYLGWLRGTGIDSLVLGCTHYPLLSGVIRGAVGGGIALISSAQAVAEEVRDRLAAPGAGAGAGAGSGSGSGSGGARGAGEIHGAPMKGKVSLYTSDSPEKFAPLCRAILGEASGGEVRRLDIEKYESRLK